MEEFRVITKKGIDIAEIDYDLQRDTSGDAGVDSNVFPTRTVDVSHAKATNNRITCYMLEPEEAEKKGISISDEEARKHVYRMPYSEWKEKFQK